MTDQPNKPGAEDGKGKPEPTGDQPAVENQGSVTPDDYPDRGAAEPSPR